VTVGEPGSELRALEHAEPETSAASARIEQAPVASDDRQRPGLGSLHSTLDRLVAMLGLRALTVVVDDLDLGRQAFRAGPGPFEAGTLAGPPGCRAEPTLPADRVDAQVLVELCAASLRLDVMRADGADVRGVDAAEIALRRLPGVHAVAVEHDGDLMIVQVHAGDDAPPDLARAAAHATAPLADTRLVVEVMRDASPTPTDRRERVDASSGEAPITPSEPVTARTTSGATIVAVRSDAETGEIEVHVRAGEVRTIGRAPMAQGLSGAVSASLDALRAIDPALDLGIAWARTIETTADRRFVVAVALHHVATRATRHGLASGASPIEAAARAALDAVERGDDIS
jgi:hypothetical protein